MPVIKSPLINDVWRVFAKELLCELRTRYTFSTLIMFALVTLSSVSMTMGGGSLSPEISGVLLWIILFFCSMAGLSRVFVEEQETGTIFSLRIYISGQAIILGKMLFNTALLFFLSLLIIPLFIIFLNEDISFWWSFFIVICLGDIGIAAASTLTAAMVAKAGGKHSLFAVLTFPILLPQFLCVIHATVNSFAAAAASFSELVFMAGYDMVIIIAAYILFDYLWYD
ncbi:MAG: heme exporter protein CcmB [Pelosinus sp.]|nr:heme exporter protein CcmB [Pelosinus sp.]